MPEVSEFVPLAEDMVLDKEDSVYGIVGTIARKLTFHW